MESEVIKIRRYKVGYEIRTTTVTMELTQKLIPQLSAPVEVKLPIKRAYTLSGDLIGPSRSAHYLIVVRGIKPELAASYQKCCSIGFCDREQRWYRWSRQSSCGFGTEGVAEKQDWLVILRRKSKYADGSLESSSSILMEFQAKTLEDAKKWP